MKIKHLVFDWDGTLADTYPVISAAYEYVFQTLELPAIPYDEIKRLTSTLQNKDTLGYIFGTRKQAAKQAYYDYINRNHLADLQPIPGAADLLAFAAANGYSSYLVTNKKRPFFLAEADKLGFTCFFNHIVAAGDCAEDKPNRIATHAIFPDGLPEADSILVIGDGLADWQTARSYDHNGKKTLFALYNPQNTTFEPTPDYQITRLPELIALLKGQP